MTGKMRRKNEIKNKTSVPSKVKRLSRPMSETEKSNRPRA
jgi:hypothetical protein